MDSDLKPMGADLSPRAGIAMLTLQLRATLQEASSVEAQFVPIDHEVARQQLREKLAPLLEDRMTGFAEELAVARAAAAETVRAAHDEAARILSQRAEAARVEAERLQAERVRAEQMEVERLAAEQLEVERLAAEQLEFERLAAAAAIVTEPEALALPDVVTEPEVLAEPEVVAEPEVLAEPEVVAAREAPEELPPTEVMPNTAAMSLTNVAAPHASPSSLVLSNSPAPINVTIDADAFARVFATVFASLIEHRLVDQPTQMYLRPMMEAPVAIPVQPKQGFWSQARHPDVLLMGLATVIVLVVLAAWLV
jgi:hypothetical protein